MRCWEQHANNLTKAIRWGLLEDKEVVPMRRLKLILAALAMMLVMMAASAAPAIANHDNDGWWDNCNWVIIGWHWIPPWFWGGPWSWDWTWSLVCVPEDNWWGHDKWDDDDDDWRGHDKWDGDDDDWRWRDGD